MNKTVVRVLIVIAVLLLLFIFVNQVDAPPAEGIFTHADLVPASFETSNGFYFVASIAEPPEVDVMLEETVYKYRGLNDPEFGKEQHWESFDIQGYHNMFLPHKRKLRFINQHKSDWYAYVQDKAAEIKEAGGTYWFLLERFGKLLQKEVVRDFSMPPFGLRLDALLMTSRLYTAHKVLDIQEGRLEDGVNGLLAQLALSKKLVESARSLDLADTARRMMQDVLAALNSLMNQPDFPRQMIARIFQHLPPLPYEQYGNRNAYIGHYLSIVHWIDVQDRQTERWNKQFSKEFSRVLRAFMQKKRTRNYYFHYLSALIGHDARPPYQWESPLPDAGNLRKGPFWWIQNPVGKYVYSKLYNPVLHRNIYWAHQTKAVYDLVRIGAQLRLNAVGTQPAGDILTSLESFKATDPFSGKSFLWNEDKRKLYSVGPDGSDDGGQERGSRNRGKGYDIAVYCRY